MVGERGRAHHGFYFFLLPPPGCLMTRRHQLPRLVVSFSSMSRLESARRECSSSWAPPGREYRLESMYMYYNYTLYTQRHYFVNLFWVLWAPLGRESRLESTYMYIHVHLCHAVHKCSCYVKHFKQCLIRQNTSDVHPPHTCILYNFIIVLQVLVPYIHSTCS